MPKRQSRAEARLLRAYEAHGVSVRGETDTEWYGDCPFTGKDGKFYVNKETGLWHSKTLGEGGNVHQFLQKVAERNAERLSGRPRAKLKQNRKLPFSAYESWEVGWDGKFYTIPIRDDEGRVVDLRRWRPGRPSMATPGCKVGLLGHDRISESRHPIYLCEGEWDAMALQLLFDMVGYGDAVVVGTPGASIFKDSWVESFRGRSVYVCYDNDEAGEQGELQVQEKIEYVAKNISYLHWDPKIPDQFDIRDWVINGAVKRRIPKKCWRALNKHFFNTPRKESDSETARVSPEKDRVQKLTTKYKHAPTLDELRAVFNQWLYLRDTSVIECCLAVTMSQEIQGDPVWMFLVGPPGTAKSEMINAFRRDDQCYHTSSITPHALISGQQARHDPSLIPKLDGKVFMVKDFTAILGMNEADKSEIFSLLRDAYDGHCKRDFGNGVVRQYDSRFTILAGVTPSIYELAPHHQALGERFLKFLTSDNLRHYNEDAVIMKAISNVNQETEMHDALQDVTHAFLEGRRSHVILPGLSDDVKKWIADLAKFCAFMRGVVPRDQYRNRVMVGRPSRELATRLAKQLTKLSMSVALVHGDEEVQGKHLGIVKKTGLDTIQQRREDLVRCLHLFGGPAPMRTKDITMKTRYPLSTVSQILDDLVALGIVERVGRSNRWEWQLSEEVNGLVHDTGLYRADDDRDHGPANKPAQDWLRRRVRMRRRSRPRRARVARRVGGGQKRGKGLGDPPEGSQF